MATTEQRIKALEYENIARKSQYPIAASLIPFVVQISPTFSRYVSGVNTINVDVQLTPNLPSSNGKYMISLYPEVFLDAAMTIRWPRFFYHNLPQTGNGKVTVRIQVLTNLASATYYMRVTAAGTSAGTFIDI